MVISGHRPHVVNDSEVVEMLDHLSLDNDDDYLSVDSDSPDDTPADQQQLSHSNSTVDNVDSDSVQKDKTAELVSSSGSDLFSKAAKWSGSDRLRQGLFKNCIVDVSYTGPIEVEMSAESHQQESLSVSDSIRTVDSCKSHKLQEMVSAEQTTLERVKTCLYEWKTTELVAFLRTRPTKTVLTEDNSHQNLTDDVTNIEAVKKDSIENSADKRGEVVKQYEQKVGEFYGRKPRVRFTDSCKQVTALSLFL